MRRWLDQYCFALLFLALLLAAGVALALDLPATHKTVTINGLCDGWKAYRTASGDLYVICPGGPNPPPKSVELRAFYTMSGPR